MAQVAIGTPTKQWTVTPLRSGAWLAEITFNAANDKSDILEAFDRPIEVIHVLPTGGGFNAATVTIAGSNRPTGNANTMHQTFNPGTGTFDGIGAEMMAGVVENPRYVYAQVASGAPLGIVISIILVTTKST